MVIDEQGKKRADWAEHIKLDMSPTALKRLNKRGHCQIQKDHQWYWIKVQKGPQVFDKRGKQLDKATLRAMLKRMA